MSKRLPSGRTTPSQIPSRIECKQECLERHIFISSQWHRTHDYRSDLLASTCLLLCRVAGIIYVRRSLVAIRLVVRSAALWAGPTNSAIDVCQQLPSSTWVLELSSITLCTLFSGTRTSIIFPGIHVVDRYAASHVPTLVNPCVSYSCTQNSKSSLYRR